MMRTNKLLASQSSDRAQTQALLERQRHDSPCLALRISSAESEQRSCRRELSSPWLSIRDDWTVHSTK